MNNDTDWNICPPEILCMIFQYLDVKELVKCMLVNKKWRAAAEYTAEYYKVWEDIIKKEMINNGITFLDKSVLCMKDIYRNYLLWNHVGSTDVNYLKTYVIQGVKKMNVYKDNLILINDSHVLYYDINTFEFIRDIDFLDEEPVNFEENDYLIVRVILEKDLTQTLYLYIKKHPDMFYLNRISRHVIDNIRLFRLENKKCYVLSSNNVLWCFIPLNISWDVEFLARHYGSDYDELTALHIRNDNIYVVSKYGSVWYADTIYKKFVKVYQLRVPHNVMNHNWTMFETYSCVSSISDHPTERVKVYYHASVDAMMLRCVELTCALSHGDVLILGFKDGRVEIRIPKKYRNESEKRVREPERYFNIQQYGEQVDDPTITGLNVCEMCNHHILLVSTPTHIFQFSLTYPPHLL